MNAIVNSLLPAAILTAFVWTALKFASSLAAASGYYHRLNTPAAAADAVVVAASAGRESSGK